MSHQLLAVFCLSLVVLIVNAQPTLPTAEPMFEVNVTTGIVYGQGQVNSPSAGFKDLLLDLYEPIGSGENENLSPVVIIIHGGRFSFGSRQSAILRRIAKNMASHGYVVVSIDYRLIPDQPIPSDRVESLLNAAIIPGLSNESIAMAYAAISAIDDSLTATDWIQANAESHNIDPNLIGLLGGSAGAFTAVHLGYILNNYDITSPQFAFVVDFWGGSFIPANDRVAASNHLEYGEPALFIVHGTADDIVPIEFSELLAARAQEQRTPYEYYPIDGGGHGLYNIDIFTEEASPGVTLYDRMMQWTRLVISGKRNINVNYGMVGSWYNPNTPGQGFFIDIDPFSYSMFVGWFVYDTTLDVTGGEIPGSEQRWFTALGRYLGSHADLTVYQTRGGQFNLSTPVTNTPVGTLSIEFIDCDNANLTFNLELFNLTGTHSIQRLFPDSVCQLISDGLLQIPRI